MKENELKNLKESLNEFCQDLITQSHQATVGTNSNLANDISKKVLGKVGSHINETINGRLDKYNSRLEMLTNRFDLHCKEEMDINKKILAFMEETKPLLEEYRDKEGIVNFFERYGKNLGILVATIAGIIYIVNLLIKIST